jgi:hypothetical protein
MDRESKNSQNKELIMTTDPCQVVSKRTLAKGAVAAGLVLSVTSRSAWGTNCAISGMLSGNTSRAPESYECRASNGKSPNFWKKHLGCWSKDINMGQVKVKLRRYSNYQWQTICSAGSPGINSNYLSNEGFIKDEVTLNSKKWYIEDVQCYYGETLDGCLPGCNRYSNNLMYYLDCYDSFAKEVAAAMLSAIHPQTGYGYSAIEIAEAVLEVLGDDQREYQLEQILVALQDGYGDSSDMNLKVYERFA